MTRLAPRTFQGRLTLAFVAVVAVTLGLVGLLVVNRLGAYFDQQQQDDLDARARGVAQYVITIAEGTSSVRAGRPVVTEDGEVDEVVIVELSKDSQHRIIADQLAKADVQFRLGLIVDGTFLPAKGGMFSAVDQARPQPGQQREPLASEPVVEAKDSAPIPYAVEVTLLNPYTYRAAAIQNVTGLLAIIGLIALAVAVVVAAMLTRRITTPLRRLTEASRDLAEGDFARRVPSDAIEDGPIELSELGLQFNAMAERLQESVEIIRRDRDRSREFLADVSHELRTPIAALRTFNELLTEGAADDPPARAEFLETSRAQLERLDWLAQNLLELSKLDSGLVLLDLRPEDLRSAVEQAVEQAAATARRRGVALTMDAPGHGDPDPPRPGPDRPGRRQPRSATRSSSRRAAGRVRVEVRGESDGGAIDHRRRHGHRHRSGRAAPDLRPVLPRLARQRGPGQRQRARPGDRPEHRRDARRHGHRREPARRRERRSASCSRHNPGRRPHRTRAAWRKLHRHRRQNLNPEPAP